MLSLATWRHVLVPQHLAGQDVLKLAVFDCIRGSTSPGTGTIMVYPTDSPNAANYDNRYFDIYDSNGELLQRAVFSADDIKNVVFYSRGQNDMF